MGPSRATLAWAVLAAAAAVSVQQASAAISLRMPVIPWYSVLRGGYVDLITRQPVTTQLALANAGPMTPGNPGAFQPQTGLFNPAPRPTSRTIFPLTLPSLAFWEKCFKETDPLSALVTKCNYQDTFTTCTMLANMGYLPKGVQSFEAKTLTGSFSLPTGCASASLGVSYDKLFRLTFNSPQVPILAVISKDPIGSMVSYFGTGTTQGRVKHRLAHKVEFCYAPTISEITVAKTAIYSTGMQPGTASWAFAKAVELPQPYANNRAVMFNGDSVDATWTLMAQKSGADVSYQGMVQGTISINNPTPAVITVTSIIDQVTSGPAATVVCPVGVPFTVPACSFATCQYTAYYPYAPPPGSYTTAAQVQFQVLGSTGYPSMAQGASVFNVGVIGAPGLAVSTATIPVGAAMISDPQAPQGQYMFSGPGQQSFATPVTCGGAQASGAMSNSAVMTAATGQQIMQSATIQKQCYDLSVTVVPRPAPFVGRWGWGVTKTANPSTLRLKPNFKVASSPDKPVGMGKLFSKDAGGSTTGDVIYTVTYTRNPPAGFAAGAPAFEASGEVIVQNPAPINARVQSVLVTISNPNGAPYTTEAVCPMLTIPASQRVSCAWRANPTFNPVGSSVRGIARYINLRNGEPRGQTTDFTSAPASISGSAGSGPEPAGGDEGDGTGRGRALLQTWGGAAHHTSVGMPEELDVEPAVATTLYDSDGNALVVPNNVLNGTGIIVSGAELESGAAPVMAMAQGVPVELPPNLKRGGLYINEAGPSPGGNADSLQGLQDECVDIADTFVTGDNAVSGQLISGTMPSGRICGTTTFTYTMRYGPYDDCQDRRSVNAATFQTVDTQTRGSSQSDVTLDLDTCANPAELKVTPGPVTTTAQGGYTWLVSKRADVKELVIGQDATSVVTYTVDYKRVGNKAASSFAAEVTVENPTAYPIGLEATTYTATTMCGGAAKTTSGAIACDSETVPAQGSIKCKVSAAAPCIGHGAYTAVLTAAGGFSITSPPAPFVVDTKQLEEKATLGECADVRDSFESGEGQVGGAVVSGTRPNGRLCGSKTFTYGVRFGPFSECSRLMAVNTASLTPSSGAGATSTNSSLPITVVGCDLYAPAKTADADCVKPPHWWHKCSLLGDDKCNTGWTLLPGGKGKGTLFFPKPNERSARNYTAMLVSPHEVLLNEARRVYQEAAKQFVAAQLNFLSGARLPTVELQETFDALGSFLSTSSEGTAADEQTVSAIAAQADLLGAYNNGTLPGAFKAPPACL